MRPPSYCFKSLEAIFYFRMRIPTDLQQIFNRPNSRNLSAPKTNQLLSAVVASMWPPPTPSDSPIQQLWHG